MEGTRRGLLALEKMWTVSLPAELGEAVRRVVTGAPEDFVADAIRHEIARRDQWAAIQEAAGAWHNRDDIPDTVECLVEFMRQLRASEERHPE